MMKNPDCILKGVQVEKSFLFVRPGKLRICEESPHEISSLLTQERLIAYQKGKEEGEREGYLKAHYEVEALGILLQALTKKILEDRQRLLAQLKPEILTFCVEVCKRFLQESFKNPDVLVELIERLLSLVNETLDEQEIHIHLSKEDQQLIEHYLAKDKKSDKKKWKCILDPCTKPGTFRLETKTGLVNCQIDRELDDLLNKIQRSD